MDSLRFSYTVVHGEREVGARLGEGQRDRAVARRRKAKHCLVVAAQVGRAGAVGAIRFMPAVVSPVFITVVEPE